MKNTNWPKRTELLTLARNAGQNLPDSWSTIVGKLDLNEVPSRETISDLRFSSPARKWVSALNIVLVLVVGAMLFSLALNTSGNNRYHIVNDFLNASHTEFNFMGLEWNMSKQQVIHALALKEDTYDIKHDVDIIWISSSVKLFEVPGISANASFSFARDQLYAGGYIISVDTMDKMLFAFKEIVKQIDNIGMNEQFHGPSGDTLNYLQESSLRSQMERLSFITNYTWRADNGSRFTLAFMNSPDTKLGFVLSLQCSSS